MSAIKFIISILLLILITSLAVKNMDTVAINYYDLKFNLHTVQLPLSVVILGALFFGFICAWFFSFFGQVKLKTKLRKQTKIIENMGREMDKIKPAKEVPVTHLDE
ncbi:MAG: LapA family protein [Nitrospinales bacterium]